MGVYLGHSPFHVGSLDLVSNNRTGHVSPQYHVVFDNTFSTVEHTGKGTDLGNWKKLLEEQSELATQETINISKEWHRNEYSSTPLPREACK